MLDTQTGRLWIVQCAAVPGAAASAPEADPMCEHGLEELSPVPYQGWKGGISPTP